METCPTCLMSHCSGDCCSGDFGCCCSKCRKNYPPPPLPPIALFELDEDGYPTPACISSISESRPAPGQSQKDWLLEIIAGMRSIWHCEEFCWSEREVLDDIWNLPARRFFVSTMGWSGNEELLRAWKANAALWYLSWRIHQVGGHYVFQVRLENPPPYKPTQAQLDGVEASGS